MPVDYGALAAKHGGQTASPLVDYAKLAVKHGAVTPSDQPIGLPPGTSLPGIPAPSTGFVKPTAQPQLLPSGFNPLHPIDNFKNNSQMVPVKGSPNPLAAGIQDISASTAANLGGMVRHPLDTLKGLVTFGANDPIVKRLDQAKQEFSEDPGLAIAHGLGDVSTGILTDGMLKAPGVLKDMAVDGARSALTKGVDEPIANTSTTPRQRYEAAQRSGVNLDLADATENPFAKGLKAVNQDSLFGSSTYEKARGARVAGLNDFTDTTVNEMSPLDRETGGYKLQDLFKNNQQSLKQASDEGHGYIQKTYGDAPVADPSTLSSAAERIQQDQAQHLSEFPSLKPGKVSAVVDDAARFGKTKPTSVVDSGLVDEYGHSLPSTRQPEPTPPPTIGDALKARSGILDMYQNNPELVKSSSDAQLQQLVGATHDTVMDSLPGDAQKTLRDAQLSFKEMKQKYDNPSSPLYDMVRTANPSAKTAGIGPTTPESIRDLVGRVGDEGTGIMQRGMAEKLLGNAPGADAYNFKAFPRQLSNLPQDYARELFGDENLQKLRDISDTSQALTKDLNPSGTAKQTQKLAEAVTLLKTGGVAGLHYPLARLMNSPALVDMVMNPKPLVRAPRYATPIFQPSKANGTR